MATMTMAHVKIVLQITKLVILTTILFPSHVATSLEEGQLVISLLSDNNDSAFLPCKIVKVTPNEYRVTVYPSNAIYKNVDCNFEVRSRYAIQLEFQDIETRSNFEYMYIRRLGTLDTHIMRYVSFYGDLHSCNALFHNNAIRVYVHRHKCSLTNHFCQKWSIKIKSANYDQNARMNYSTAVQLDCSKSFKGEMQEYNRMMIHECNSPGTETSVCPANCTCIACPDNQRQEKFVICPDDTIHALDMSRSYVRYMKNKTFTGLNCLNMLDLHYNGLLSLEVGSFTGLSVLNTLDLSWNNLGSLKVGIFTDLGNLNTLNLRVNNLVSLEVEIFTGLSNLNMLDLSWNNLVSVEVKIFKSLSNLTTLDLSDNDLASLEVGIFTNLCYLNTLDLAFNDLRSLEVGIFLGLRNLNTLNLAYNDLRSLKFGVFTGLSNLTTLYLHENQLDPKKAKIFTTQNLCNSKPVSSQFKYKSPVSVIETYLKRNCCKLNTKVKGYNTTSLDLSYANLTSLHRVQFLRYCHLLFLDLGYNHLTVLETGTFLGLCNLQMLNMINNRILRIDLGAFTGFCSLDYLFLSHNELTYLHFGIFADLTNLKTLDLSFNSISALPVFKDMLYSLTVLNISNNNVTSLSNKTLPNLIKLAQLDLSNNELRFIQTETFKSLSNLNTLDISKNMLQSLDVQTFEGKEELAILNLGSNRLRTIVIGTFFDLKNLTKLILRRNSISHIQPGTFNGIEALMTLDLSFNRLTNFKVGLFRGLNSFIPIMTINLQGNQLKSIQAIVTNAETLNLSMNRFQRLNRNRLEGHNCTKSVNLSGNDMEFIQIGSFLGFNSLITLDLSRNNLRYMEIGTFIGLSRLKRLNLMSNSFTSFQFEVFMGLKFLEIIVVDHNIIMDRNLLTNSLCNLQPIRLQSSIHLPDIIIKESNNRCCQTNTTKLISADQSKVNVFDFLNITVDICSTCNLLNFTLKNVSTLKEGDFSGFCNLISLDLGNNHLSSLEASTFRGLCNLNILDIRNNIIKQIELGAFAGLCQLSSLYLQNNNLQILPIGIFSDLNYLTNLDLSLNCLDSLSAEIFLGLIHLSNLNVSENKLEKLETTSLTIQWTQGLSDLKSLDLGENNIASIDIDALVILSDIVLLKLCRNDLRRLNKDILTDLHGLHILDISHNIITSLPIKLFASLSNLEQLDISNNALTSLLNGTFNSLTAMKSLDLSVNELSYLPKGIFRGLSNMKSLELSKNNLESLSMETFTGLNLLKRLNLSENNLQSLAIKHFFDLNSLETFDLGSNRLRTVDVGTFFHLRNLATLILRRNKIASIQQGAFAGLNKLEVLDLGHNKIISLRIGIFVNLSNLRHLKLDWNQLVFVQKGVFHKNLNQLNSIDLRKNLKLSISESTFSDLPCVVHVSTYQEYCECVLVDGEKYNCSSDGRISPYSSCRLLAYYTLANFMTLFGTGAILANLFVLIWKRISWGEENKVQSILLSNLAVSDLLMGIYMLTIALADYNFNENYLVHSPDWRCSHTCFTAGTLAITSSEASVFFITLISIDRLIRIKYPYTRHRLCVKSARIVASILWLLAIAFGVIPHVIAKLYCTYPSYIDSLIFIYDVPDVCVGLPLSRVAYSSEHPQPSMYYSIGLFIGLNLPCFLIILGCYVEIIRIVKFSSRRSGQSGNTKSMQRQIRLTTRVTAIIATDFCCWFPIIIISILGQSGVIQVDGLAYAVLTTFVLPINSTINPFLYTIVLVLSKRPNRTHALQKKRKVPRKVQNKPKSNIPKVKELENTSPNNDKAGPCGIEQMAALDKSSPEQQIKDLEIELNKIEAKTTVVKNSEDVSYDGIEQKTDLGKSSCEQQMKEVEMEQNTTETNGNPEVVSDGIEQLTYLNKGSAEQHVEKYNITGSSEEQETAL